MAFACFGLVMIMAKTFLAQLLCGVFAPAMLWLAATSQLACIPDQEGQLSDILEISFEVNVIYFQFCVFSFCLNNGVTLQAVYSHFFLSFSFSCCLFYLFLYFDLLNYIISRKYMNIYMFGFFIYLTIHCTNCRSVTTSM